MPRPPQVMVLASLFALAGCASRPAADPAQVFVAQPPRPVGYSVALYSGGSIGVRWQGQEATISTKFSQPSAGWKMTDSSGQPSWMSSGSATGSIDSPAFSFKREVRLEEESIRVRDTFTNFSNRAVGTHLFHRISSSTSASDQRLAGLPATKSVRNAFNPSVFASYGDVGLGMVAESDAFRVHALLGVDQGSPMLSDDQLAIGPGKSVAHEWAIVPVASPSYWSFVNAVRRSWQSNRTIEGPFAFTAGFGENTASRDAAGLGKWAKDRGLKFITGGMPKNSDGTYAHGTAGALSDYWMRNENSWQAKLRTGNPESKTFSYFHMQLCTEPGAESKFADSRLVGDDGQTVVYPNKERLPLMVPTPANSYGKALVPFLQAIKDRIKPDGIYWDEMSGSFGANNTSGEWDGVTGILDPRTKELVKTHSAVPLQILPMSAKIIDWTRANGLTIIANSMSRTRTLQDEPFMRFQETLGNFDKLANTHLQWPLGLANNNKEDTAADSVKQVVGMLDHGAVYCGFRYVRQASPWNFTSVLYPITPVELHEGVVIGRERILANRSGTFGFPDGSEAEVVVVDSDGAKLASPSVSEVKVDGKRAYRVTVQPGQFAAIIKR